MEIINDFRKEISHSPLFSSLDHESMSATLKSGQLITMKNNEHLFLQDDASDHFFILRSGTAKLYIGSLDDKAKTVEIVIPGNSIAVSDMFSEVQVIR